MTHYPGGINNQVAWIATDAYCLCLSRFPLKSLARRFCTGHYPNNASCVRISDAKRFAEILDREVRAAVESTGRVVIGSVANEVAYCDFPDFQFDAYGCAIHPAFVKPHIDIARNHHYWIEGEYRLVWDLGSTSRDLPPLDIACTELTTLVEIIEEESLLPDDSIPDLRVRAYTQDMHSHWVSDCRSGGER